MRRKILIAIAIAAVVIAIAVMVHAFQQQPGAPIPEESIVPVMHEL